MMREYKTQLMSKLILITSMLETFKSYQKTNKGEARTISIKISKNTAFDSSYLNFKLN